MIARTKFGIKLNRVTKWSLGLTLKFNLPPAS
jgi:hypothetical protein